MHSPERERERERETERRNGRTIAQRERIAMIEGECVLLWFFICCLYRYVLYIYIYIDIYVIIIIIFCLKIEREDIS